MKLFGSGALLLAVFTATLLCCSQQHVDCFHMVMMARRGKGNLQRSLDDSGGSVGKKGMASLNQGKGQEITGVTLPEEVRML